MESGCSCHSPSLIQRASVPLTHWAPEAERERNSSLFRPATRRVLTRVCFCHWAPEQRGEHAHPKRRPEQRKRPPMQLSPFSQLQRSFKSSLPLTEAVGKGRRSFLPVFVKGLNSYSVCHTVGPRWHAEKGINGSPCSHSLQEVSKGWITF